MRSKTVSFILSSLILAITPAIAIAQPISNCRIETSKNSVVSLGFPFQNERLNNKQNPKILVLPFQLKDEPKYTLTEIDRGFFTQAAASIKQLSQNKSVVEFVYGETISLDFTTLEMDSLRINQQITFQKDFRNSTYGFVERTILEADQKLNYAGIDAVILFGSSSRRNQAIAEAMMFTKAKLAFGYGVKTSGSNNKWWDSTIIGDNWFDPIKSAEGDISNAVLIYNQLNHSVLTHEIMHLYGLTDLYGSATSPNHSLMSNGIIDLLGIEEWVLGWLPDENVQCINLESELSKTSSDNKLSIKKSNRNQLIVIPTGPKTALIVEQVYQAGKNHLLYYSLDNDARPAITTFRDDRNFELFIDVSGTSGAARILTGKTFNLLVESNNGNEITFRLIPSSLMNTDETKKFISAAEVIRQDIELKLKQESDAKVAAELKIKQEAEAKVAAELKAKQDAEAKAAADKAAELKAKQDAEAKVAAELKSKQEAEAKVAAELKAKQDAEAKASAELKAKQEAEAKAAADKVAAELKAKQEAEAKAAAYKAALVIKKTTITCAKGKSTKKVTAIKPVCPKGYKKK
jgi:hypothetical protein